MNIDQINAVCQELSAEAAEDKLDALVNDLEAEELDAMMLALGPRAFGPDMDEGANDSGGLFYWDLK
jgi:hypothetical protein